MACGGCGAKNGGAIVIKYRWVSDDGSQTVKGLTRVQATTRLNTKGGTIYAES
jgi:hypothetical protein